LFEREHHQRIATVLEALDADRLVAARCLFGGGTAMALRYGEYRESVDIDFLISSVDGYRQLRQALTGLDGIRAITRTGQSLHQIREIRADQYGIRTLLLVGETAIKFEVILEGRIVLESPGLADRICGIATLTPVDLVTSKLLANSDRWRDDSAFSRDLIDLAMMTPSKALLVRAIDKAAAAYGASVETDLMNAIRRLRERPGRLDDCMRAMRMTMTAKPLLSRRIRALAR
jgi:hypothetical protein